MRCLTNWLLSQVYSWSLRNVTLDLISARDELAYMETCYTEDPRANRVLVDEIIRQREYIGDLQDEVAYVEGKLARVSPSVRETTP